jgi:predicted ATPase/DNA-binding SARP family transcriptional activator
MGASWRITLMGGLSLRRTEAPAAEAISRFPTRKTAALLAYLAYYLDREHPREVLIGLLWPEVDLGAGRQSLSVALSALRRLLEPEGAAPGAVLISDRICVRLSPAEVETDVRELEAKLAEADSAPDAAVRETALAAAVAAYGGTLLPGFYEDWIPAEQERLASRYFDALDRLVELHAGAGRYAEAMEFARKALAIDPLRESAHRQLIRLYAATDQASAAIRQYQELERQLRRELDAHPSDATRALIREIQRAGAAPAAGPAVREAAPASAIAVRPPGRRAAPVPLSRFFGREAEVEELVDQLSAVLPADGGDAPAALLVTLTGPAGCGKTRLAVEVARRLEPAFGESAFWMSLGDVADARRLPGLAAEALGADLTGGRDPLSAVLEVLARGPHLLVLDNFEQLVEEGSDFVLQLATGVTGVALLVTSRQRLALSFEREHPVRPLSVPVEPATNASLLDYPSVRLFADRAQLVRREFELTEENAAAVGELCARLEGIPLAIELAAARAAVLTPNQMLDQLRQRFRFLVSHQRDLPARHQTLHAALEWSVRLLAPPLQRFFARLSIFRGGWTLSAALAIAASDPAALKGEPDPAMRVESIDWLEQLIESSLIFRDSGALETSPASIPPELRFRMLETLREFGDEQLGDEREAVARRHAGWCLHLVQGAEPHLRGAEQIAWLSLLEREHENIRAALAWGLRRDPETALRIGAAFWWFWHIRGHFREGLDWLEQALRFETGPELASVRSRALNGAGNLAFALGDADRARRYHEESLALARGVRDLRGIARSLNSLGHLATQVGDYEQARVLYEESLELCREQRDPQQVATMLGNVGVIARRQGDLEGARALQEESLRLRRELGDRRGEALCLLNLGNLALAQDQLDQALALYAESLQVNREIGAREAVTICLQGLATAYRMLGEPERAVTIYGAVEGLREALHCPFWGKDRLDFEEHVGSAREALSPDQFDQAWARGRSLSLDETITLALPG